MRRGYFVEGLSGAQFAHPGAVDRLRAARPDPDPGAPPGAADARLLAALDPANPYGALLPWPAGAPGCEVRPRRVPGARVVLVRGDLVLYASADGRQLLTFGADEDREALGAALAVLAQTPAPGRRRWATVEEVDGLPVARSPVQRLLLAAGYEPDYRGLRPAIGREGTAGARG